MILHIIRHGETVYNAQKRLQGQRNIPLNEQGSCRRKRRRGIFATPASSMT